jgi:hypothetical protein
MKRRRMLPYSLEQGNRRRKHDDHRRIARRDFENCRHCEFPWKRLKACNKKKRFSQRLTSGGRAAHAGNNFGSF